ncbi:MAG: hypothetical protein L0Y43_02115, partial [Methylococcaceae bacterium]|nr:hypothetical protein [Methylococcaceae bacterium]
MSSKFKLPRVAILVAVLSCLLHIRNIPALDLGVGDWQAHGYVSQGYTYTSSNNFFGNSQENGSFDF